MRTTVTLDNDATAAVGRLRCDEGIGFSEAVNRLIRAGMARPHQQSAYRLRSSALGIRVDVSTVLELLDEP